MHNIEHLLQEEKYISRSDLFINDLMETKYLQQADYHNKLFIRKKLKEYKEYFDHILDKENKNIKLDFEQRLAILTDEDYNLIIAGAGSGKTTTMVAKIKYLIEKCHIPGNQILAMSFARKNVMELDEKLNKIYQLGVDVKTFHKLGCELIGIDRNTPVRVISQNVQKDIILDFLKNDIYQDKQLLHDTVNFLSCYFYADPHLSEFESFDEYKKYKYDTQYESLKGNLGEYNKTIIDKRRKAKISIQNEFLRSYEELKIANFLFLNGIEYEYEKRYPFPAGDVVYYPDFTIKQGENIVYLEHFGIHQNGSSDIYSADVLHKYLHEIDIKKQWHEQNKTKMICTYSQYNDGRSLLVHLEELLTQNGFILHKLDEKSVYDKLFETSQNTQFYAYLILALSFIAKFKLTYYQSSYFDQLMQTTDNERTFQFLKLTKKVYQAYQDYLTNHHLIDFEDMIIQSIDVLSHTKKESFPFQYQYVIVDEYQDISDQRFELLRKFVMLLGAKVIAVGDDWQSIFAFAGSNVSLFTQFEEVMGYAEILRIQNTYRNSQELIDVASEFVEKNNVQIHKELHSNIHLDKPVVVYSYDDYHASSTNKGILITKIIQDIIKEYSPQNKILLIGRYQNDLDRLLTTGLFQKGQGNHVICTSIPSARLYFATAHGSKGVEYDNVIIINAIDSTYGFPSKVKDDPIFLLFGDKRNLAYAEERRLFYVALTRTKSRVYIIVPASKPSPFVLELKENIHVEFKDDVVKNYQNQIESLTCPHCGFYLKREYFDPMNQYVYRCTNDKNICDFITTELTYKVPIKPCPKCKKGFIIFKTIVSNHDQKLLMCGCTNYREEEIACTHVEYFPWNKAETDTVTQR